MDKTCKNTKNPSADLQTEERRGGIEKDRDFPVLSVFARRIGKTKPPVILGVSKKSFSNRITLLCYDKGGLATTNKNIGGFCNKYRHKTFITFEMEMQIPYCICAQISKTGNIWKAKS